jgi:hypothetical protein
MLGARRGNRKSIATTIEHEGSRWRVANGRMDELAAAPRENGRIVPMPAGREDQIRTIAAALRARKLPAEAMLDGRFVFERDTQADLPIDEYQADPVHQTLLWGDRITKRLMIKIALELLAYYDADAARSEDVAAPRRFARYDEGDESDFRTGPDNETPGAKLQHVDALYFHGIEIWTAGGKLNYLMTLLSEMRWAGILIKSWKGGPFRASYTFDAIDPGKKLVVHDAADGAALVNKSYRVRVRELQDATARFTATNGEHAARQKMRAPAPDPTDLYPDVLEAMNKTKK